MDEKNTVSLLINGKKYGGWLSVDIQPSLLSIYRSFTVGATRNNNGKVNIPFEAGNEVQVMIGEDRVVTGYVEEVTVEYSATSVTITVKGNSKTKDLSDCQLPLKSVRSWKNVKVIQILSDICQNFGIGAVDKVGLQDKFSLEIPPEKAVGEALTEFLKKNSMILTDDAYGNLVVFNTSVAEKSTDSIELGKNVLTGKRVVNVSKVYSNYVILGQSKNSASTQSVKSNQMSSSVVNNAGSRARWSVVKASGSSQKNTLDKRAELQKSYSVADADTYTYKVQGWRQSDGKLWTVGNTVIVKDGFVRFPSETEKGISGVKKIISKITYKISSSGTTCEMECKDLDAFINTDVQDSTKAGAIKKSKKTAGGKSSGSSKTKSSNGTELTGIKQGSGKTNSSGNWAS